MGRAFLAGLTERQSQEALLAYAKGSCSKDKPLVFKLGVTGKPAFLPYSEPALILRWQLKWAAAATSRVIE